MLVVLSVNSCIYEYKKKPSIRNECDQRGNVTSVHILVITHPSIITSSFPLQ